MASDNNLLDGNGNEADALNNSGAGALYVDNQTAFDVVDNGKVSQTDTSTTINAPNWGASLSSLFGLASQAASTVSALTGKTTAPAATVAAPTAGTATTAKSSGLSMPLMVGIGLALVAAVFFFAKRR